MNRDNLKRKHDRTLEDRLSDTAKAALGVGLGAAIFFNAGGVNKLSKISKYGGRIMKDFKTKEVRKEIYESMKELDFGKIDKTLKRSLGKVDDSIRIGKSKNSISTTFNAVKNMEINSRKTVGKIARAEMRNEAVNNVLNHIGGEIPDREVRAIKNLVDTVYSSSKNITKVDSAIDNARKHLSDSQIDKAVEIAKEYADNTKRLDKKMLKKAKNLKEDVRKKLLDIDNLEKTYGSKNLDNRSRDMFDKATQTKGVTVRDVLENEEIFNTEDNTFHISGKKSGQNVMFKDFDVIKEHYDFLKSKNRLKELDRFENLYVDYKSLRIDKDGQILSYKENIDSLNSLNEKLSGTIPGQILRLGDLNSIRNRNNFEVITKGSYDPILAKMTNKTETIKNTIDQSYIRIYEKMYEVLDDGSLEHIEKLDDTFRISGKRSTSSKMIKKIAGDEAYREQNKFFTSLDLNVSGTTNVFDKLMFKLKGDLGEDDPSKIVEDLIDYPKDTYDRISDGTLDPKNVIRQIENLNKYSSKSTAGFSPEIAEEILKKNDDKLKVSKDYFEMLSKDNEDMIQMLLIKDEEARSLSKLQNQDLISLMENYYEDNNIRITKSISQHNIFNMKEGAERKDFFNILRYELSKEAILRYGADYAGDSNHIEDIINNIDYDAIAKMTDNLDISGKEAVNIGHLSSYAAFQHKTGTYSYTLSQLSSEEAVKDKALLALDEIGSVVNDTEIESNEFLRDNLRELMENYKGTDEIRRKHIEEMQGIVDENSYGEYITVRKSVSALGIIEAENKYEHAKAFAKQFAAGRDNLEDVSVATMIPYFMSARLSDAVDFLGIGLSQDSSKSTADIWKNIFMKRVLPVGAAITAYQFMDDFSEDMTGTSVTGAFGNTFANIDLGFRRVMDFTGIGRMIDDEKKLNPALEYLSSDDEFDSYDERKEWYESGYTPVRKSRWWAFGSLSEFRGSEIMYYQPSYLRRIHSDYKDKTLYDSNFEKWAHAKVPNPYNIFAPITYAINPYWLEKKHSEDMPYPVTGQMYSENTPWGLLLNNTIGRIIKPQKMMHEDRLDENMVDIRTIIEDENRRIYQKAKDDGLKNIIRLEDGVIDPVNYTSIFRPSLGEAVISNKDFAKNIETMNYGIDEGIVSVNDYMELESGGVPTSSSGGSGYRKRSILSSLLDFNNIDETILDIKEIISDDSTTYSYSGQPAGSSAYRIIGAANQSIRDRAYSRDDEDRVITREKLYRSVSKSQRDILYDKTLTNDLVNVNSGDKLLSDLAYQAQIMSGAYGFGLSKLYERERIKVLADSGDMTSITRGLADANVGGMGGELSEIVRRFVEDKNPYVEKVNPLMNTMPDWLPDKFRKGNPYTAVPKGEARLPGKGYESLNKLHPDMFGDRYGAFDRYKILADVAPNSEQYKVWRDISRKTVKDPLLKEEMEKIEERIKEQNKKHDFYYYKFNKDNSLKMIDGTVTKVIGSDRFKIAGSDRVYNLAGVKGNEIANLSNYIEEGIHVRIGISENEYEQVADDGTINAALFVNSMKVNQEMLRDGAERADDISAAAIVGTFSSFQRMRGRVAELITHFPAPYYQSKFMRVRTPLESYKEEQVYGTPFATWDRPIDSFLKPAIERSLMSNTEVITGQVIKAIADEMHERGVTGKTMKAMNIATAMSNRGAFAGGGIAGVVDFKFGDAMRKGSNIGSNLQLAAFAYTRKDDHIMAPVSFGMIGAKIGKYMGQTKEAAALGAAVGIASGMFSASMGGVENREEWKPERTKRKWDKQEYFDRLTYVKFNALYEKAARKAKSEEGTDIIGLVEKYEKDSEKRVEKVNKLGKELEKLQERYADGDYKGDRLKQNIQREMQIIRAENSSMLGVGKWGREALLYKQVRDSTIYGLDKDSSWSQVLRSIPKMDRDYFLEFAKEKDPEKRREIEEYISPYTKKALRILWEEDYDEAENNREYFKEHDLPGTMWSGWRPQTDLENVMIKDIHNEGDLLADYGYYDSSLRDSEVINAPTVNSNKQSKDNSILTTELKLASTMKGLGLTGVDVAITPNDSGAISVVADIKRNLEIGIQNVESALTSMIM